MTKQERVIMFLALTGLVVVFIWNMRGRAPHTIDNRNTEQDIAPAYLSYNLPFSYYPIMTMATPVIGTMGSYAGGYDGYNGCGCFG